MAIAVWFLPLPGTGKLLARTSGWGQRQDEPAKVKREASERRRGRRRRRGEKEQVLGVGEVRAPWGERGDHRVFGAAVQVLSDGDVDLKGVSD